MLEDESFSGVLCFIVLALFWPLVQARANHLAWVTRMIFKIKPNSFVSCPGRTVRTNAFWIFIFFLNLAASRTGSGATQVLREALRLLTYPDLRKEAHSQPQNEMISVSLSAYSLNMNGSKKQSFALSPTCHSQLLSSWLVCFFLTPHENPI